MKASVLEWLDDDSSATAIQEASDIFIKARMTKCEVLTMRAMWDSRKKAEHLERCTTSFVKDCFNKDEGDDWRLHMFPELAEQVAEILAEAKKNLREAVLAKGST